MKTNTFAGFSVRLYEYRILYLDGESSTDLWSKELVHI